MKIGFTGTRFEITKPQWHSLYNLTVELGMTEGHHGDCIGGDWWFNCAVVYRGCKLVIHPPDDDTFRAFCAGGENQVVEFKAPKPYLARNRDTVDDTDRLIATPKEFEEENRSGTWSTIRYARKRGKPIYIVRPDGTIFKENEKMIKEVTVYASCDGLRFDNKERAVQNDTLYHSLLDLEARFLGPRDPRVDRDEGYWQHDVNKVNEYKKKLIEIGKHLYGASQFDEALKMPIEDVHPGSVLGRIINDGGGPLSKSWNRLSVIDSRGREWQQPYFAWYDGKDKGNMTCLNMTIVQTPAEGWPARKSTPNETSKRK